MLFQKSGEDELAIAYASTSLNKARRNYGDTKFELLAVVFAIEKFLYYLEGAVPF